MPIRELIISLLLLGGGVAAAATAFAAEPGSAPNPVVLPEPRTRSPVSLEEAIFARRSVRSFADSPLTVPQVSQLLWAAGGKTLDGATGATRSCPSAGGIYPLEIYLLAGRVENLSPGIYRYHWKSHELQRLKNGDFRAQLARAAWGQECIAQAPISIVITGTVGKTAARYGDRGEQRYVPMDVGHAGQNIHLQAQAIGLGTVVVGAFQDADVLAVLGLRETVPFYIMPIGQPARRTGIEGAHHP